MGQLQNAVESEILINQDLRSVSWGVAGGVSVVMNLSWRNTEVTGWDLRISPSTMIGFHSQRLEDWIQACVARHIPDTVLTV